MTMDRDIRFSPGQIAYLATLTRKRRRELNKKIERATENARAGQTIQHGTLDAHVKEFDELGHIAEALEVARQQIVRQMKDRLGVA